MTYIDMTYIDMSPRRETTCCVCERETDLRQGLAVYEDVLVADDAPQPWGGMAACWTCYMAWRSGVLRAGMTFTEALRAVETHIASVVVAALCRIFSPLDPFCDRENA